MRTAVLLALICALTACGGRVARPVAEVRTTDPQLSCDHIRGEAEVNAERILDLLGERKSARDNNAALLLAAPVSLAFPMFLDLGQSEQREVRALESRNRRLDKLGRKKGCPLRLPAAEN